MKEMIIYNTTRPLDTRLQYVKHVKNVGGLGLKEAKGVVDSVTSFYQKSAEKCVDKYVLTIDNPNIVVLNEFIDYLDHNNIKHNNNRVVKIANLFPYDTVLNCIENLSKEELLNLRNIIDQKL